MTIPFGSYSLLVKKSASQTHAFSSHVKFTPNSAFVLASTQDSTIRLWNYQNSRCVKTYTGHTNRTYCIPACFITNKGKYIVSGSEDNKIYIWDLQTRKILQILEGHRGKLVAPSLLAFADWCGSPDVVLAVAVSGINSSTVIKSDFMTYTDSSF